MTLRCLLLGHRRSRSCASYDEKHALWISECKRCHVLLIRERGGHWRELPTPPDKLMPVKRGSESSTASPSSGEAPFLPAGATDATDGGDGTGAERVEQPVELAAS